MVLHFFLSATFHPLPPYIPSLWVRKKKNKDGVERERVERPKYGPIFGGR